MAYEIEDANNSTAVLCRSAAGIGAPSKGEVVSFLKQADAVK